MERLCISGLTLSAVHVNEWLDWVFVHVDCSGGAIRGLGELCAGGLATSSFCGSTLQCLALIQAKIVGQDPCNVVALTSPLLAQARDPPVEAGGGKEAMKIWLCAVSAVEQALWDILGKYVGQPVYRLLGGAHNSAVEHGRYGLRLYANINRISRRAEERTPANFAANAVAAVAAGHSAIKMGPFDAGHHAQSSAGSEGQDRRAGAGGVADWDAYIGGKMNDISADSAQLGIACVREVREAVGPEIAVLVDVHSRFTLRGATQLLEALRPLNPYWLEDTVAGPDTPGGITPEQTDEFVAWAALCGAEPTTICAGGEQHPSATHALDTALLLPSTYQTMLADVLFLGGIAELKVLRCDNLHNCSVLEC